MSQGRRRPPTKPPTPRRIPHNQALQPLSPRMFMFRETQRTWARNPETWGIA